MRRMIFTALALSLAAAALFVAPRAAEATAEDCTHHDYDKRGHKVAGDRWHATFHVERPCLVELWSFTATRPNWPNNGPGRLYGHESYRLGAGEHTKSVALPPCFFQADVTVNGRVVDTQTGGTKPCPPPSTTTTAPTTTTTSKPSTTTTSSTAPTSVTTSSTVIASPTTTPTSESPSSTISPSAPPPCVEGSTSEAGGSPTGTECELAFSGSNGILGVIGTGVILGGSLAYLGGRRRRQRFEAELEAQKW